MYYVFFGLVQKLRMLRIKKFLYSIGFWRVRVRSHRPLRRLFHYSGFRTSMIVGFPLFTAVKKSMHCSLPLESIKTMQLLSSVWPGVLITHSLISTTWSSWLSLSTLIPKVSKALGLKHMSQLYFFFNSRCRTIYSDTDCQLCPNWNWIWRRGSIESGFGCPWGTDARRRGI